MKSVSRIAGLGLVCFLSCCSPLFALSVEVDTPGDVASPPPGSINLRKAIGLANSSNTPTTITFDPAIQEIVLSGTPLQLTNINHQTTITGPPAGVTISGNGASRVFQIDQNVTASFSNINVTAGLNGAIYANNSNLTLNNVTVSGNTSSISFCPGISSNSGSLTLRDVTVSDNVHSGYYNARGGGIYNSGTAILTNVTVSGNAISDDEYAKGGGICNEGIATLANVTVSDNAISSQYESYGGGIYNSGTMILTNVTVSGNTASASYDWLDGGYGGGIYNYAAQDKFTIRNTIVAENNASTAGATSANGLDVYGYFSSGGYNLIGKTDGAYGFDPLYDRTGTIASPLDPELGPLADNGGPTLTMALLPDSPAIDHGYNDYIPDVVNNKDQRGLLRIANGAVDIGAYEYQEEVSVPTSITGGPATGFVGQALSGYSPGGSSSSMGHQLQYEINWGDGSTPTWGTTSHTYGSVGTFNLTAQAGCATHTDVVSGWSPTLRTVTITNPTLTVGVSPLNSGTVSRSANPPYVYGQTVTLTPHANAGYAFDYWGGDTSNGTVTMNGDKNVTAYFAALPPVAPPVFNPSPGTYPMPMDVTITCATAGAEIRYTTDLSTPTSSHGMLIASGDSVPLTTTTTLKAISHKAEMADSAVTSGVYTKMEQVDTPTFAPVAPYPFATSVDVTITCATAGATIRYTTNGADPTSGSTLYTAPVHLTATTTLKARAFKAVMTDSGVRTGVYTKDSTGPTVSGIATVPTSISEGVDLSLSLAASASDASSGGSNIVTAEYFIGQDPGTGDGTPMTASDGAFDEPTEGLTATVDTASWTAPSVKRINVRARDAAGNWTSPVSHIDVSVIDGTRPSPAPSLSGKPGPGLTKIAGQAWDTLATLLQEEEELVIDLGEDKTVGAVGMRVDLPLTCFPTDFAIHISKDESSWDDVGKAAPFRLLRGQYLWQCEPSEYRYVRITAWSRRDRNDGLFYIRVPEVGVYASPGGNSITVAWPATADDDNDASSGNASVYDLRFSSSPITEANWNAAAQVPNEPTPGVKGTLEDCTFSVGDLTTVYVGLKIGDEVPNWSSLKTAGPISAVVSGFTSIAPDDLATLGPSDAPPTFEFQMDPYAGPRFISFSGCDGFPQRPTVGADGELCKMLRFPLKKGADSWIPSLTQWTAIRKLVHTSGLLYWRLEGKCPAYGNVYGACRTICFECGDINNLHVAPSYDKGGEEAVRPDKNVRPTFSWSDATNGMAYFLIDVSTDETIPLSDKKSTKTFGGRGISSTSYTLNAAEWKTVRKLGTSLKTKANSAPANGTLHWRVRALTADRALSCASAVKMLIVDEGDWTLDPVATDPLTGTPRFSWTHSGDGIVKYRLEFCYNDDFGPSAKETLKVPAKSISPTNYTLKTGEWTRLVKFAERNHVLTLHWRVRGEDADSAFICYSDSATWQP